MSEHTTSLSRGAFLKRVSGLLAIALIDHRSIGGPAVMSMPMGEFKHPDPRPGITAEHVLTKDDLGDLAKKDGVQSAYDAARGSPEIFDGLACACGCTMGEKASHRSLLSCYESRQPTGCGGCREEAELVASLAKDKKNLAEIRTTIDKKWG